MFKMVGLSKKEWQVFKDEMLRLDNMQGEWVLDSYSGTSKNGIEYDNIYCTEGSINDNIWAGYSNGEFAIDEEVVDGYLMNIEKGDVSNACLNVILKICNAYNNQ